MGFYSTIKCYSISTIQYPKEYIYWIPIFLKGLSILLLWMWKNLMKIVCCLHFIIQRDDLIFKFIIYNYSMDNKKAEYCISTNLLDNYEYIEFFIYDKKI